MRRSAAPARGQEVLFRNLHRVHVADHLGGLGRVAFLAAVLDFLASALAAACE